MALAKKDNTLPEKPLGLIAGESDLPKRVVQACKKQGRPLHVIYIKQGTGTPAYIASIPHTTLRVGEVGKAISTFKKQGVTDVVFAGKVPRSALTSLKVDITGARLLAKISSTLTKGDNAIFSAIVDFFQTKGFSILGAHEVATELLAPKGIMGKVKPSRALSKDVEFGKTIAHQIGELDIGQSVVVQNGAVLGVEAVEGTDNLIKRCKKLQPNQKGAVLVKMKKPSQDARIDMPTIGLTTIRNIAKCGFSGIAIEAGGTLMIDRDKVIEEANKLNVFLVGV